MIAPKKPRTTREGSISLKSPLDSFPEDVLDHRRVGVAFLGDLSLHVRRQLAKVLDEDPDVAGSGSDDLERIGDHLEQVVVGREGIALARDLARVGPAEQFLMEQAENLVLATEVVVERRLAEPDRGTEFVEGRAEVALSLEQLGRPVDDLLPPEVRLAAIPVDRLLDARVHSGRR